MNLQAEDNLDNEPIVILTTLCRGWQPACMELLKGHMICNFRSHTPQRVIYMQSANKRVVQVIQNASYTWYCFICKNVPQLHAVVPDQEQAVQITMALCRQGRVWIACVRLSG